MPGAIDNPGVDRPATAGPTAEFQEQLDLLGEATTRPGTAATPAGGARPWTQGRVSLSEIAGRPAVLEERSRKVGRVPRRHSLKLEGPDNAGTLAPAAIANGFHNGDPD